MTTAATNFIAGVWEEPHNESARLVRPAPHDRTDTFVTCGSSKDQLVRAAHGARAAAARWGRASVVERANALSAIAAAIRQHASVLAEILVREVGKTEAEALGEIANAVRLWEFFAGSAWRPTGCTFDSGRARTSVTARRVPLGVVLAVTPWNFPINLAAGKLAPALAAGNSVIVKPAPEASHTTTEMIRFMAAALPDGVLSLVHGGAEVGAWLVAEGDVDAVTFTGSTRAGRAVVAAAGNRGLPVQCEMGGKNTIAVMASANVPLAAAAIAASAFRMAGQKCTAVERIAVRDEVYDEFLSLLAQEVEKLKVGDPREPDTDVGPVINDASRDRILSVVSEARKMGASLAWPTDGQALRPVAEGSYVSPVVLENVSSDAPITAHEIFGPVLTTHRVGSLQQAIEVANAGNYGLVSAVYTSEAVEAQDFCDAVQSGTVLVNQPTTGLDFHTPFGGWRDSGHGPSEQSDTALAAFTKLKTTYVCW